MVNSRADLAAFGERVAGHRLESAGMTVLARNVRTPSGEIDLVATDGSDLVFVEVRTRRANPGAAAESLLPAKLQRMWRCAMEYCETTGHDPEAARVDVIAIDLGPGGQAAHVEHLRAIDIPGD